MAEEVGKLPELQYVMQLMEAAAVDADDVPNLEMAIKSKPLSRDTFFNEAYWAILVSNASYDTARAWEEKARSTGFPFEWEALAQWHDQDFDEWCKEMAKMLSAPREDLVGKFRDRWWSIWDLGWWLAAFPNDDDFRYRVFHGKTCGEELRDDDVRRLAAIRSEGRLWMIGHANRYFILRNLGGDFLKPDVWVQEFCRWYGDVAVEELADLLREEGISCGRFDAYLWSYCAREIRETSRLGARLDELFMDDSVAVETLGKDAVTIMAFEDAVWEVEGVRVVVRDRSDFRIGRDYGYERAAKASWRVSELLDKRVRPAVDDREVAVVEGGGSRPHGKTLLRTVRASYRQ